MNIKTQSDEALRKIWVQTRSVMETENIKHKRYSKNQKRHWNLFEILIHIFAYFLKFSGLYAIGYKNAKKVVVNHLTLEFLNLPEAFDGYTLLHMTDLHLDGLPGIEEDIIEKIKPLSYDLCVLTGDYREAVSGGFKAIVEPFRKIISSIHTTDGIIATLGNHDSYLMIDYFNSQGVRVLGNEKIRIWKGEESIEITGIDDTYYYYTAQADYIIEQKSDNFKILLTHTPDLYDIAAQNDFDLYLCGHTHGGQICLPGGHPIITHVNCRKKYTKGLWKHRNLQGYTSRGCGVVGIPVRLNCRSEVTLVTLKKI